MGDPYTDVTVLNYNANPPPDDGSQTEANRVKHETAKTKLSDPLKTAIESINTNVGAAIDRVMGGAGVTTTGVSYQVLTSDQGKVIQASASGITITTPDASVVNAPFVFAVANNAGDGSSITVDGSGAQTINGNADITVPDGGGVILWTDGSNWVGLGHLASVLDNSVGLAQLAPGTAGAHIEFDASGDPVELGPDVAGLVPTSNGAGLAKTMQTPLANFVETDLGTINDDSLITHAHGLGAQPSDYRLYMEATASDVGYAIGERVQVSTSLKLSGDADFTMAISSDTTNIYIVMGAGLRLASRGNFNDTSIDEADWKWILRVWP